MSRTIKGSKGGGYDYGDRSYPSNRSRCVSPGKGVKRMTHQQRRAVEKRSLRREAPCE